MNHLSSEVLNLKCRGCGAPLTMSDTVCKYCGGPVTISTFNSVNNMALPLVNQYTNSYKKDLQNDPNDMRANKAIAYCYLKLRLYDKALEYFEKSVLDNFDDSEVYFYAAISLLKGKKAFYQQKETIDKSIEYTNAAIRIQPLGIYYYFLTYLKFDYYKRKCLNTNPPYTEILNKAKQIGISEYDINQLYKTLDVDRPNGI